MVVKTFSNYQEFLVYTKKNINTFFSFYCPENRSLNKKNLTIFYILKGDVINHINNSLELIIKKTLCFNTLTWKIKFKKNINIIFDCNNKEWYKQLLKENCLLLSEIENFIKATIFSKYKKNINIIFDFEKFNIFSEKYYLSNAFSKALMVQKTKKTEYLIPSPPEIRAKIYSNLRNFSDVKTQSMGNGKLRRVSIKYKKKEGKNERNNSSTRNKSK
ncbi:hypothetical protein [Spiroplasma endosymbiont of Amphibalanus improvisus]|uniref:hypothetical protein n=1 Tax=Spiroplasma endosymbiont of Amphibalanus improvisus TaxID=3066327 RepID=UPI00313DFDD1